jgi:hypothetical protein
MSRVAATHADWLGLLDTHGQFLTLPVLREAMPDGLDRTRPELRAEVRDRLAALTGDVAERTAWLEFLLRDVLGWGSRLRSDVAVPAELAAPVPEHNLVLRPDYALVGPAGAGQTGERARVLVMRFPLGTDLTTRIPGEKWVASPIDRVARLCRATGVPIGVATDTNSLALVSAPIDKPVGYGIWPSELLGEEQGLLDSLISVLGAKRFFAVRADHQLETLLVESASKEHEVTTQLGKQVRRAVEMLVAALSRANNEHGGRLLAGVDPHAVYESAVTVMMRLVFLLYAEERHLLPLGDPLYDTNYAASTLREQLRTEADIVGDEPLELRATAWHRLLATFRAVHAGITHDQLRLPAYGGSLFDPDRFPFLEGRAADEPWRHHPAAPLPVDDATVLAALTALQVLEIRDGGVTEARRLSFRTLDVEQIGHVYEGLLDHGATRVEEVAVGLVGKSGVEAEVPLATIENIAAADQDTLVTWLAQQTGKSTAAVEKALATLADADLTRLLHTACENDATVIARVLPYARLLRDDLRGLPMVFLPGSVYVTETTSRRDSGTEYTTKELADEIVQHALEPLVYAFGPGEGVPREQWRLKNSREILALRVADPAVGSGAVIVAACRYLADKLVEAWVTEGTATVPDDLADDVDDLVIEARRAVADRCLYGVDRDPMAVEMAKLSIWLTTMARERPFSFLDHAFRAGDSLLGVTSLKQVEHLHVAPDRAAGQLRFVSELEARIKAALAKREELEAIPVVTMRDAEAKARLNIEAEQAVHTVRVLADLVVGAALSTATAGPDLLDVRLTAQQGPVADALDTTVDPGLRRSGLESLQETADAWLNLGRPDGAPIRRPLHWPIEFPEVFADGGFSALVGNPPFQGGQMITGALGTDMREYLVKHIAGKKGSADLVAYFFLRAAALLRAGGSFGFIATKTIAEGKTREVGLDRLVADGAAIYRAVRSRPWPGTANLHVAQVWLQRPPARVAHAVLDGDIVPGITTQLRPRARVTGAPKKLPENGGQSFQGTIVLGMGFILGEEEAGELLTANANLLGVLKRFVNGEDVNNKPTGIGDRWVIDFGERDEDEARSYPELWQIVEDRVKPDRARKGGKDLKGIPFWRFLRPRPALYAALHGHQRVLVCSEVTKHLSFAWLPTGLVFSANLDVFPGADDYLFGVLQSGLHEAWARRYSAHLETRLKYSCGNAFETFVRPARTDEVAAAGRELYELRDRLRLERRLGLTNLYNLVHDSDVTDSEIDHLRTLHQRLDQAVTVGYGWTDVALEHDFHDTERGVRYGMSAIAREELLDRLLELNHSQASTTTAATKPRRGRNAAAPTPDTLPLFPSMTDEDSA